jgi:integrase
MRSIRQLRWEDFQYDRRAVFWRAEGDKKGYKWEVPMPAGFFETVKRFQRELGAVGGFVFWARNAHDGITDRHLFDKWLSAAEKKAKLPRLDGSLWHAYRRKWAIEREQLPLRDVAAAGGNGDRWRTSRARRMMDCECQGASEIRMPENCLVWSLRKAFATPADADTRPTSSAPRRN